MIVLVAKSMPLACFRILDDSLASDLLDKENVVCSIKGVKPSPLLSAFVQDKTLCWKDVDIRAGDQ